MKPTSLLEHRLRLIPNDAKPGIDLAIDKELAINARHQVVLAYYLLERRSEVLEHAMALVAEVQDFFLGDWVESYVVNRWVEDPTHSEEATSERSSPGVNGAVGSSFGWRSFATASCGRSG